MHCTRTFSFFFLFFPDIGFPCSRTTACLVDFRTVSSGSYSSSNWFSRLSGTRMPQASYVGETHLRGVFCPPVVCRKQPPGGTMFAVVRCKHVWGRGVRGQVTAVVRRKRSSSTIKWSQKSWRESEAPFFCVSCFARGPPPTSRRPPREASEKFLMSAGLDAQHRGGGGQARADQHLLVENGRFSEMRLSTAPTVRPRVQKLRCTHTMSVFRRTSIY